MRFQIWSQRENPHRSEWRTGRHSVCRRDVMVRRLGTGVEVIHTPIALLLAPARIDVRSPGLDGRQRTDSHGLVLVVMALA